MSAAGAKPVILGVTRRVAALGLLGPAGFVTVSLPLLAPAGMVNLSGAGLRWVMAPTSWPLRVALVTVSRLLPLTVTTLPTVAAGGVKLVMVGSRMTVKLLLLVPVPPGLVTAILPVVAVGGMSAWMVLSSLTVK